MVDIYPDAPSAEALGHAGSSGSPDNMQALLGIGAYTIGDDQQPGTNYGQNLTESFVKTLIPGQAPLLSQNWTDLSTMAAQFQSYLETFELDMLRMVQPMIPGATDEDFATVDSAVAKIMSYFSMGLSLGVADFNKWVTDILDPSSELWQQAGEWWNTVFAQLASYPPVGSSAATVATWWSTLLVDLGLSPTDAANIANFISGNYDAAKQAKQWWDDFLTSLGMDPEGAADAVAKATQDWTDFMAAWGVGTPADVAAATAASKAKWDAFLASLGVGTATSAGGVVTTNNTMISQITDIFNGSVVTPINTAVQHVKDWFNSSWSVSQAQKTRKAQNDVIISDWFHTTYPLGSITDTASTLVGGKRTWWGAWNDNLLLLGQMLGTSTPAVAASDIGGTINNHLNNVVSSLTGTDVPTQQTPADAAAAMESTRNTLVDLSTKVQAQQTVATAAEKFGRSLQVYFADYPDGPFSQAPFTVTKTGTGNATLTISGGQAKLVKKTTGTSNTFIGIYNAGVTLTDYQEVTATISSLPNGTGATNYALVRANTAGTTYVYAGITLSSSMTLDWILGCVVSGTNTVLASGSGAPLNFGFTLQAGVGGNPYRFRGIAGNKVVFDYTDSAHVSQVGSTYRSWGFLSATDSTGNSIPASASYVGCADNALPVTQGSGFRMSTVSTTERSISVGTNTSPPSATPAWGYLPLGFFDTINNITPDITPTTTGGHDAVQMGTEGWYLFELRSQMKAQASSGVVSIYAGYLRSTGGGPLKFESLANGPSVVVNVFGTQWQPTSLGGNCPIYCKAGDLIVPIVYVDTAGATDALSSLKLFGEVNSILTYWSMTKVG